MHVSCLGRPDLDLETICDIKAAIAATRPDVIVNAAAFTNVEEAERNASMAFRVNADGAGRIAAAAQALRIPLIHVSTEYVFDGTSPRPYRETDATMPLNVYGRSKLAGEIAVAAETDDCVILRTSWVYSPFGWNFLTKIRAQASQKPDVNVIDDRQGAPTSALEVAWGIERIAHNLLMYRGSRGRGLFHMTCHGETSWAGFATEIIAQSTETSIAGTIVRPVSSDSYQEMARRPINSCLSNEQLAKTHGVVLAHWQDALARVMARLYPEPQSLPWTPAEAAAA